MNPLDMPREVFHALVVAAWSFAAMYAFEGWRDAYRFELSRESREDMERSLSRGLLRLRIIFGLMVLSLAFTACKASWGQPR
jgi:hypothetical protein